MRLSRLFLAFLLLVYTAPSAFAGEAPAPDGDPVIATIEGRDYRRSFAIDAIEIIHRMDSARFYFGKAGMTEVMEDLALTARLKAKAEERFGNSQEVIERRERRHRYFLINDYLKSLESLPVSEADQRAYYERNPSEFVKPEERQIRHIFKEVPEKADAATKEAIRKKMEALREKLLAGGDFAAIAAEESEQESAKKGGSIGWVGHDTIKMKPFADAAFRLPPNLVSDLVETPYGYHLIRVDDVHTTSTIPFETVLAKGRLNESLQRYNAEHAKQDYLAGLKGGAKLEFRNRRPQAASDVVYTLNGTDVTAAELVRKEVSNSRQSLDALIPAKDDIPIELIETAATGDLIVADVEANHRIPSERMALADQMIKDATVVEALLKQMAEDAAAISPEKVRSLYEEEKARYTRKPPVDLSQIVIPAKRTEGQAQAEYRRLREDALARAREARSELDKGRGFEDVVKQYSGDPTASSGGHLGWIEYGSGGPHIDDLAQKMKVGEVSDVIETNGGFLIIRLNDRKESTTQSLEEADPLIRKRLLLESRAKIKAALIKEEREAGRLVIHEDRL